MNIYISNLSFNVQDEDLRKVFTKYGQVSSAKVITDSITRRSRGFAFVEMPDNQASKKAIAGLDGTMIDGKAIKVTEARQKKEETESPDSDEINYNNSDSYNENRY